VPNRVTFLCGTDPGGTPGDDVGLYVVRASDSENLQRVTVTPAGCFDTNAVASPDGGDVLFVRFCGSEEHGVLFRVRTDGSHLEELSPSSASIVDALGGMSADWSPDGSKVVFCTQPLPNPGDEPYTMFVENADGSELRQVVSSDVGAVTARWSPDGRSIAFTSKLRSEPQVWTGRPDGSGLVKLTDGSDGSTSLTPVWSPDGKKLLYASAVDDRVSLRTMDVDGGQRTVVADISNVESIGYAWGRASAP
jgi:Tol biopolymer transport system component